MNRLLLWTALVLAPATVFAQSRSMASGAGFTPGYSDIGPVLGLGNIGGAGISIGGRFEHAIKSLPDMGDGILGFEASIDYYSYGTTYSGGYAYNFHYIPLGATANYHFKLDNWKIDPFLGLGLGYLIENYTGSGNATYSANSGLYFIGRAGMRYFLSPHTALYGDLGAGAATLNVGLTFGM